jgi:riboflavin biosynthesis pyrimidine reductase
VRRYLAAGLIDELRLHVAPVIIGPGERPLEDVGDIALEPLAARHTPLVTHLSYRVVR